MGGAGGGGGVGGGGGAVIEWEQGLETGFSGLSVKLTLLLYKNGTCSAEISIRIASAMAAMERLNRLWRSNTISFASKFKSYKSLCHLHPPPWL